MEITTNRRPVLADSPPERTRRRLDRAPLFWVFVFVFGCESSLDGGDAPEKESVVPPTEEAQRERCEILDESACTLSSDCVPLLGWAESGERVFATCRPNQLYCTTAFVCLTAPDSGSPIQFSQDCSLGWETAPASDGTFCEWSTVAPDYPDADPDPDPDPGAMGGMGGGP